MRWKHFFRDLKFKQKLIISYLLLSLVPITVLGIYSYYILNKNLQAQASFNFQSDIETDAAQIQKTIEKYNDLTNLVVLNAEVEDPFSHHYTDLVSLADDLKKGLDPYFTVMLNTNPEINQLTVFTQRPVPEYGNYIRHFSSLPIDLKDKIDPNAIQNVTPRWISTPNNVYVILPFPTFITEYPTFLIMSLNPNILFDNFNQLKIPNQKITLMDENGDLVFAKSSGTSIAGQHVFQVQRKIPDLNWTLTLQVSEAYLNRNSSPILNAALMLILLCLLLISFFIAVFTSHLLKPIRSLYRNIRQVGEGNLKMQIRSESKDEIGLLTNRFGEMVMQIDSLIQEVYQSKINQREAEIKALQAQMNPHFLYNVLATIHSYSLQIGEERIIDAVSSLSTFYRTALNRGEPIISIRGEIENVRAYLELQLIMHDSNFQVVYDLDNRIFNYSCINFILQPIVENAIEHGIEKRLDKQGCLQISGKINGDRIDFLIADNGPGFSMWSGKDYRMSGSQGGYGLHNVNERIRIFYGEQYGVSILSRPGECAKVRVSIPLQDVPVPKRSQES